MVDRYSRSTPRVFVILRMKSAYSAHRRRSRARFCIHFGLSRVRARHIGRIRADASQSLSRSGRLRPEERSSARQDCADRLAPIRVCRIRSIEPAEGLVLVSKVVRPTFRCWDSRVPDAHSGHHPPARLISESPRSHALRSRHVACCVLPLDNLLETMYRHLGSLLHSQFYMHRSSSGTRSCDARA